MYNEEHVTETGTDGNCHTLTIYSVLSGLDKAVPQEAHKLSMLGQANADIIYFDSWVEASEKLDHSKQPQISR